MSSNAFDRGASAGIYKGKLIDKEPFVVAVKVFGMLGPYQKELLVRELRAARQVAMQHPLIVAFLGTVDIGEQRALVSLYMRNGNLLQYLRAHPRSDKKKLVLQVAEAVNHIHGVERLVHGDLKCVSHHIPPTERISEADFGLSTFLEKNQTTETGIRAMNTVQFAAPELLISEDDKFVSKTCESDVYGFVMLVLEAMVEQPPWGKLSNYAVVQRVCSGQQPRRPRLDGTLVSFSHGWWDTIKACWSFDPATRPSISAVLRALTDTDPAPREKARTFL
ncbi:kinase-like protein [Auricularia subglabra TFB-10046 SS5]|nr:kinase-like protein [Auricularia subglabra TFB-10046 SS5]